MQEEEKTIYTNRFSCLISQREYMKNENAE